MARPQRVFEAALIPAYIPMHRFSPARLRAIHWAAAGTLILGAATAAAAPVPANPPATAALERPANDPGAPLNLDSYSPAILPGKGLRQHSFFYTGQYDFRHPVQRMVVVRGGEIVWSYEIPTHAADTAKTRIQLHLDNDILKTLSDRAELTGKDYETLINDTLRHSLSPDSGPLTIEILRQVLQ